MKKTMLKSALAAVCLTLLFTGCPNPEQLDPGSKPNKVDEEVKEPEIYDGLPEESNKDYGLERADSLDWIFNNETLGKTTITIKRSEWQELCDDYRYFYKNENCVHAETYEYEKDGHSWTLNNIGFRLRGNTSRYCPQGIDNGNQQGQMNADWNPTYYSYANNPNDDYRQTHFKVDFEEFLPDDGEKKMAGCMKGVALKRMDESCTREIFCYDLFRKNGIWTAPRASHTRLIIKIIEDGKDNSVTTVDYGVYEMFEEVNKQSLKARDVDNNSSKNAWKSNKGNLWKCANDLTTRRMNEMGIEDIRIIHSDDEDIPVNYNHKEDSTGGNRIGWIWDGYSLDLKTNKESFDAAAAELRAFITALNALPTPSDENDTNAINSIKDFYEKWFDMNFFLKTYAINIICGMDDDYWGNANNFYLYFDTGKKGSGKVYLIPFDYDNTLGHSINGDKEGTRHNPLDWGRGKDRPLMDKLLLVPEYKEKFTDLLLELCQNEYWNFERCSQLFLNWGAMVAPYINSPDLNYTGLGVNAFADWDTWNQEGCSLTRKSNNIFDDTTESIVFNLTGEVINPNRLTISQVNDNSVQGFKIKISNIPSNAAVRDIFINDKHVASLERDWSRERNDYDNISEFIFDDEWQYPYTEDGQTYKVYVKYLDRDYNAIESSRKITVTAHGGQGELSANKDKIRYSVVDNVLVFDPAPLMKIGNSTLPANTGYYKLETDTLDWNFLENKILGQTVSQVDLEEYFPHNKGITKDTLFQFRLYYEIPNGRGDNYRYVILDFDDTKYSELHLTSDFVAEISEDKSATKKGLNIIIDEKKIPEKAYNRAIYINGKEVCYMGRIYNNGEFPAEHIKDTKWNYPYVKAGNKYRVSLGYWNDDWAYTELQGAEFEAKSGLGELSVNKVTYRVQDNNIVFSSAPLVTLNGNRLNKGNFRIEFRKVVSQGDDWIGDTAFPYDTTKVPLNEIFRGKGVNTSTQFKIYMYYEIPDDEAGFQYRCQLINEEDSIKTNLHLSQEIPEMLIWDSSATAQGLNLKITASEIPEDAYSRELWVNGRYVLEMERDYSDGVHPARYIKDTVINYPYVEPNKEYTVYVKYHNGDWKEYRSSEIKVKPTSGLGEISLINKDSISYKIENNNLKFTVAPKFKLGDENLTNLIFKFNFYNYSRPANDRWVAGPEFGGPGIDFALGSCIDNGHRPIYTSDQIAFELFYKKYVFDEDDNYHYHYRYQILDYDDTQKANLHLTSSLLKE